MFNIGFTELVILGIVAILVIGPEQLPQVARKFAKILNDLKRVKEEVFSPVDQFKNEALSAVEKARRDFEQQMMNDVANISNKLQNPEDETQKKDAPVASDDTAEKKDPKSNG